MDYFTGHKGVASSDGKVFAIQTSTTSSTEYYYKLNYGIYIIQYNEDVQLHSFYQYLPVRHSIINFEVGLSLNYDGTVLVVQFSNDYSNYQLVYHRNSQADLFSLSEILSP